MQDELRAERLSQALDEDSAFAPMDDLELADLTQLGIDLLKAGPAIALISQAEGLFDPAFAQRLKRDLLAEHPATVGASPTTVTAVTPTPLVRRSLRRVRTLVGGAFVGIAAAILLLINALHSPSSQPSLISLQASTATVLPTQALVRASKTSNVYVPKNTNGTQSTAPAPPIVGVAQALPTPLPGTGGGTGPSSASGGAGAGTVGASFGAYSNTVVRPQYLLPSSLPTLPASAPVYALHFSPLSDTSLRHIIATFSGMHAVNGPSSNAGVGPADTATGTSSGGTASPLRFGQGQEQLTVTATNGEIRYRAGSKPVAGTIAPEAAILLAHTWLVAHALYPNNVDESATTVTTAGGLTHVRFAPVTRFPMTDDAQLLSLTVDLDGKGRVIAMHFLWPSVTNVSSAKLLTPLQALQGLGAVVQSGTAPAPAPNAAAIVPQAHTAGSQSGTTIQINEISLAYAPSGDPSHASLQPVYLVRGQIVGPGGALRPYTKVAPATP